MSRFKLVIAVLGGMLAFFGVQEWRVSQGTTLEPIAVELSEVEAGKAPDNSHWKLGEHVALYNACVYEFEQSKYSKAEPGADTKVNFVYYPVVSKSLLAEAVNKDKPDAGIAASALNNFAVLVKSKQFKTVGAIPDEPDLVPNAQGLVINRVTSLGKKEVELLKSGFPGLNTDKLLLLEVDRHPSSGLKSGGMIASGALLALGAVGAMIARRNVAMFFSV